MQLTSSVTVNESVALEVSYELGVQVQPLKLDPPVADAVDENVEPCCRVVVDVETVPVPVPPVAMVTVKSGKRRVPSTMSWPIDRDSKRVVP